MVWTSSLLTPGLDPQWHAPYFWIFKRSVSYSNTVANRFILLNRANARFSWTIETESPFEFIVFLPNKVSCIKNKQALPQLFSHYPWDRWERKQPPPSPPRWRNKGSKRLRGSTQQLKGPLWSEDADKNFLRSSLWSAWSKGLWDTIPSLTSWRRHIEVLQQRRIFDVFSIFWRLFNLRISWRISPVRRNEAICCGLSRSLLWSREPATHVSITKVHGLPITHGLGKGSVGGIWGFLNTAEPGTRKASQNPSSKS